MITHSKVSIFEVGTNSLRVYLCDVYANKYRIFKKLRYPIRLGKDVFSYKKITDDTLHQLICHILNAQFNAKQNSVGKSFAIATSALRSCTNRLDSIETLKQKTGLNIRVISGEDEAKLVLLAVKDVHKINLEDPTLLIDLGGGSTEIVFAEKCQVKVSESFPIGALRYLSHKKEFDLIQQISKDTDTIIEKLKLKDQNIQKAIGLGGNFRRIGKMNSLYCNGENPSSINRTDIESVLTLIQRYSFYERIKHLGLRQDRADVILPATFFIHTLLEKLSIDELNLPKLSIIDGLIFLISQNPSIRSLSDLPFFNVKS